jgi:hypothetical protein
MRYAIAGLALLAAVSLPTVAVPSLATAAPGPAPAVSVELDQTSRSVRIGQRFGFTSTVRNDSNQPLSGLVAHLNILGLDPDIYVDPEDWSSRRTLYLDPLPAGGSARLQWNVQAVSTGRLVLYVTVAAKEGADQLTASSALRLAVAQQRMLNAGGVLPLAVAMPASLLLLLGITTLRRRRLR